MKERLDDIEARREASRMEEIGKRKKKKKRNKNCPRKFKVIGPLDPNDLRKKNVTLTQEQRKVHEAYQILLSEYPKIIRQRLKQKRPP